MAHCSNLQAHGCTFTHSIGLAFSLVHTGAGLGWWAGANPKSDPMDILQRATHRPEWYVYDLAAMYRAAASKLKTTDVAVTLHHGRARHGELALMFQRVTMGMLSNLTLQNHSRLDRYGFSIACFRSMVFRFSGRDGVNKMSWAGQIKPAVDSRLMRHFV